MSDAIPASLREYITSLEKEITVLRLGRLVGAPEGLSEVGTTQTRIDVSELLDEVDQLKREKYAAIQHLDEAQRALVMADALLRQKYPGGLFDMGKNKELDALLGGMCLSLLQNTGEAQSFASFTFTLDDAKEPEKSRCVVTVRYAREGTSPEEVVKELRREVQSLRGRIAELEDDQ